MKIEKANEALFPRAAEIYTLSWRESHKQICSPEFLKLRDCKGYLWKKLDQLYVICDPEPVGVFCLYEGTFSDLYIHPDKTGMGYGTACLRYAMERCPNLRLTVLETNKRAIRLYTHLGLKFTGTDYRRSSGILEREMRYYGEER